MRSLLIFAGMLMAFLTIAIAVYRFVNVLPPAGDSEDAQVMAVWTDASCLLCHPKRSAGGKAERFDMEDCIEKISRGEAVNETTLAKLEMATVIRRNMPPAGYYLLHWGSSLTSAKRKLLEDWIAGYRERFYPNPLSVERFRNEPVRPLPSSVPVDAEKAALGKKLFYDVRLSQHNTLSCASCHRPASGGDDDRQLPEGVNRALGYVNTPTVFNAFFNALQFRDGRAADLKTQAAEHLSDSLILTAGSFAPILRGLLQDEELKRAFDRLYDEGLTELSVIDAIVAFEKTLLTPNCRFDRYLKGEIPVLHPSERRGYEAFKSNQCATCHAGVILGGLSCERMGIHRDYFEDRGWGIAREDLGRFNYTADERDRYRFKVPGLRNVALTSPYFHDGSQRSLYHAVKIMAACQSGRSLSDKEAGAIVSFLESLTGEYEK